jgi:SAM-dependent methyltransferase
MSERDRIADPVARAHAESEAVRQRYAQRDPADERYHPLNPEVWLARQERERAVLKLLLRLGWRDLHNRRVVEVGCGAGGNLLELLRIGFTPEHLCGLELLPERHAQACAVLPRTTCLWLGDAAEAPIEPATQDIVLQSTVFTSLLDEAFQQHLADAMWRWVRPGGGVLWYDFTYDNPRNPDVRGVPLRRVRELFPQGRLQAERLTLAPPLARRVARVHPALCVLLGAIPMLRTHVLAWIQKPPRER